MKKSRVNEIDLLRFVAALLVVFYHYAFRGYTADNMTVMPYPLLINIAKYGYLGVDLFFIISGFVILMTASDGNIKTFFISRFVRLYPAFWTCCTFTYICSIFFEYNHYSPSFYQYMANMTMLNGFFKIQYIDGVYWSLLYEMRFYILVAISISFGVIRRSQHILILWLIFSIIIKIFPSYKISYILISDYSSYFIAGGAFFLVWSKGVSLLRIGIIFLSFGVSLYDQFNRILDLEKHFNTTFNSIIPAIIIFLFFISMLLISLKKTGALGRKSWMCVGSLTYPLYLLHQNIGYMIFNVSYPSVNNHLILWGTIVLMIGAAYGVHRYVERPVSSALRNNLVFLIENAGRLLKTRP